MGTIAAPRELALLDRVERVSRRSIIVGAISCGAGALLLAGLSSDPAAVILGGAAIIAGPPLTLPGGEQITKQALGFYVALIGLFLVVFPLAHHWGLAHVGEILGWVGVIVGPVFLVYALRAMKIPPAARNSLGEPTFDVHLEISVRRGYGGIPYTEARLWRTDSHVRPALAQFGWQMSTPVIALDKVGAKVHGAPVNGAVVVVSSVEAVLVGRVKRSHFGEHPSPRKPVSPLVAWLSKPRSLRLR